MEQNPNEAVLTNLAGARNVARSAAEFGVGTFVFISTDKAVDPANVMGATKRAAELCIQALAPHFPQTRFAMVRFGNVLGSAGSVAPLFERQVSQGGPVTVTHKDMTRFFMSVEEASSLVLQAAALSSREVRDSASLFVLNMGEPVQILELAKRLIRLKGLLPDDDIKITFTGLRPGEKLNERIFYNEEDVEQTEIDGVMRARASQPNLSELDLRIDELLKAAQLRDRELTLELLSKLSPELSNCTKKSSAAVQLQANDQSNVREFPKLTTSRRDGV